MKTKMYLLATVIFKLSLSGCNVDNNDDGKVYGYIPVSDLSIIEENALGNDSKILVEYIPNSSCEKFLQIITLKSDVTSIDIAILGSKTQQENCIKTETIKTKELTLKPSSAGEYTVRAWKGKNSDNTDVFKYITLKITNAN